MSDSDYFLDKTRNYKTPPWAFTFTILTFINQKD